MEKWEMHTKFWSENLQETDHFGNLVNVEVFLGKYDVNVWTDSGYCSMEVVCQHGGESLGYH
jgi:hypothetical protein